jgi:hypothetical protein
MKGLILENLIVRLGYVRDTNTLDSMVLKRCIGDKLSDELYFPEMMISIRVVG